MTDSVLKNRRNERRDFSSQFRNSKNASRARIETNLNRDINIELNQSRTTAFNNVGDTGKVTDGSMDILNAQRSQSSIGRREGHALGSSESEPDYNQKLPSEILHENRPKYDTDVRATTVNVNSIDEEI